MTAPRAQTVTGRTQAEIAADLRGVADSWEARARALDAEGDWRAAAKWWIDATRLLECARLLEYRGEVLNG